MAVSPHSTTDDLPSGSRKRPASPDGQSELDASTTSTQPHPDTHKRVKVVHDDAEVQISTPVVPAPLQSTPGFLSALPDMPMDILEEIFVHCDPETLICIARANKAFCRLLQSSGLEHVWREAFASHEDIPYAPQDWTPIKWAGLLFGGKCCQRCLSPCDAVSFGILARVCAPCIRMYMVQSPYRKFRSGYELQLDGYRLFIPTAVIYRRCQDSSSYMEAITFTTQPALDFFHSQLDDHAGTADEEMDCLWEMLEKFRYDRDHTLYAEQWQKAKLREANPTEARETKPVIQTSGYSAYDDWTPRTDWMGGVLETGHDAYEVQ
ncbi:hypothetical protein PENSPDRAFT_148137 [Peniophora sp. CONT]|nr:hypothetical protein PENSPDRAFT_148137 [Peniophora sp. CONT]